MFTFPQLTALTNKTKKLHYSIQICRSVYCTSQYLFLNVLYIMWYLTGEFTIPDITYIYMYVYIIIVEFRLSIDSLTLLQRITSYNSNKSWKFID